MAPKEAQICKLRDFETVELIVEDIFGGVNPTEMNPRNDSDKSFEIHYLVEELSRFTTFLKNT